jgi:16S rRNA (cytidine1402-2'-O)-methyltransferase
MTGRLVLVGTPLGNREDLSPRARRTILEADVLLCEDTRSPRRLLGEGHELPARVSCFVANETKRIDELLGWLAEGKVVAYVSEAGMPVWSDPGAKLVAAVVAAGHEVDVVPGPTAATTALCHAGWPAEGALFVGFVARDGAERKAALATVAGHAGPTILYEAGNRTARLLEDLASLEGMATRTAVVARELTKVHQTIERGMVPELAARMADTPPRGEVTVVVEAAVVDPEADVPRQAARRTLEVLLDPDLKPRARAKALAELTGLDARELYDRLRR